MTTCLNTSYPHPEIWLTFQTWPLPCIFIFNRSWFRIAFCCMVITSNGVGLSGVFMDTHHRWALLSQKFWRPCVLCSVEISQWDISKWHSVWITWLLPGVLCLQDKMFDDMHEWRWTKWWIKFYKNGEHFANGWNLLGLYRFNWAWQTVQYRKWNAGSESE